jgi:hypothetical protein
MARGLSLRWTTRVILSWLESRYLPMIIAETNRRVERCAR